MGLFDYVRCKYQLPVAGANDLEFQTKDTNAQWLDRYEIREDGTLWHEAYETEDRSDPNKDGLLRIQGMMTRVKERWERDTMTGEVRFYGGGFEFSAYFVGGELRQLETIESPNDLAHGLAKRDE